MNKCEDCGLAYGSPTWVDVVIPDPTWRLIHHEDHEVVLCLTCMTGRLVMEGLYNVPVMIMSGPYRHDPGFWWDQGVEHGRTMDQ